MISPRNIGMRTHVHLASPGPSTLGSCLMSASEAKNVSYCLVSFLTSFLFLWSFFKSSRDLCSRSICFARSMSAASAKMQTDMRGRGTCGSLQSSTSVWRLARRARTRGKDGDERRTYLMAPEKRLSRWGS